MKNYLLLLALAGAFTFTGCDDDEEDLLTKKEIITSENWKLSSRSQVTTDSTGTSTTDNTIRSCESDDTYKFTSDGNITVDEGATKCNQAAPQTTTGTWTLSDNDTKLNLTLNGLSITGELLEISTSKFVVKSTLEILGETVVTTSTFSPQ